MEDKNRGFAFYENYWSSIEHFPIEIQKEICFAICRYGITGEMVDSAEMPTGYAMTMAHKLSIDNSVNRWERNAENGKKGGRPPKDIDERVAKALKENPDIKKKELADLLGISESTLGRNAIWKSRKHLND